MDLPDSDRGDFSCRRAVDSSSYKHCRKPQDISMSSNVISIRDITFPKHMLCSVTRLQMWNILQTNKSTEKWE